MLRRINSYLQTNNNSNNQNLQDREVNVRKPQAVRSPDAARGLAAPLSPGRGPGGRRAGGQSISRLQP